MATPKALPTDKPDISSSKIPTSSVSPDGPDSNPQEASQNAKPSQSFKVAFIGRKGSGRNSLAWRMNNLNDSELPALPSLPRREVVLETSTRPALRHQGTVGLQIRIVPPDDLDGKSFFDRRGEIRKCEAIVFFVDLGDDESRDEFHALYNKVKRHARDTTPFLIIGNKVDLILSGVVAPHGWLESAARTYSPRDYLECSAKSNHRVGDVLDAILKILL